MGRLPCGGRKKLTDPAKGQYGWLIPADGSEDTVWHYAPMLWEAGGDILNSDNTKAAFNSDAGVKALTTLQQMAVTDKSLYLDTTNDNGPKLMNSGKIAMLVTGPWDLSSAARHRLRRAGDAHLRRVDGGHQTIAGPDNWVVFDNGDRAQAGRRRLREVAVGARAGQDVLAGDRRPADPRRRSARTRPSLDELDKNVPGTAAFVENLNNVKKVRPQRRAVPGDLRGAGPGDRVGHARQGPAAEAALDAAQPQAATRSWPGSRPDAAGHRRRTRFGG